MNRTTSVNKLIWLLAALILAAVPFLPATPASADVETPRFEVKFSGVITALPATAGAPWGIADLTVAVDSHTRVVLTTGTAEVGMWADVLARRQEDGTLLAKQITVVPPEVRLKGEVTAKPDDPNGIGPWTIAGQTIMVTADTRIGQRGGPVDVGNWVEVYAIEEPAGTLTALRIRGIPPQPAIEIYGAIQAADQAGWILSSIPLALSDETLVVGNPQVGLLAHAAATLQSDGTLLALRLRVIWMEPGSVRQPVEFTGIVEELPTGTLNGLWTVGGLTVLVTPATAINQEKGLVAVGAEVKVVGWQASDKIVALRITVLSSPIPGGPYVRFAGRVEALPTNGPLGLWTIGGRQVLVTERTRLQGADRAQVGSPAMGGGIRQPDGTIVAAWLMILRPAPPPVATPGPRPTPSVTPGPRPTNTPGRP